MLLSQKIILTGITESGFDGWWSGYTSGPRPNVWPFISLTPAYLLQSVCRERDREYIRGEVEGREEGVGTRELV